jgi:Mrp family chromosome partitioning ATPase
MAVTDAAVLAHTVHGVVFVVGAEMTTRGMARAALTQLRSVRARHLGAVLNRVDLNRNSYYYANYYRRGYQQQYEGTSA